MEGVSSRQGCLEMFVMDALTDLNDQMERQEKEGRQEKEKRGRCDIRVIGPEM